MTKLVKIELHRFDMERVEDFKGSLEAFLAGMIRRQKEVGSTPYTVLEPRFSYPPLPANTRLGGVSSFTASEIRIKLNRERCRGRDTYRISIVNSMTTKYHASLYISR